MINDTSKEFIKRHIGPSEADIDAMLKVVSANSLDDLIKKTVPDNILLKDKLKIGDPTSDGPICLLINSFDVSLIILIRIFFYKFIVISLTH